MDWFFTAIPPPYAPLTLKKKKNKKTYLYEKQKEILQRQSDLINLKSKDFITKVKSDSTKLNSWQGPKYLLLRFYEKILLV